MRTKYCGELDISDVNHKVTLCGWVNRRRDIGNIIFVEIRDRTGVIQVLFTHKNQEVFSYALKLRNEFCIQLTGIVLARPNDQININIKTGKIEILVTKLNIINNSASLPIDINQKNSEEQRLKFRYLDLRRPIMMQRLQMRSSILNTIHNFMNKEGFMNIETPILTKSSPEGARDYLVPSRIHKGKFYALPQSPQLFKQLLMISGFDRYYQIAKCFRDEDLRSERQPEFTQVDIEASFISAVQIRTITEKLIYSLLLHNTLLKVNKITKITYNESIRRFGTDKPDLRNPLELIDIMDLVNNVTFFSNFTKNNNRRVTILHVPGGVNKINHKKISEYIEYVKIFGAKELNWIIVKHKTDINYGINSSIKKILGNQVINEILSRVKAIDGDILFFIADTADIVSNSLGALRVKIGYDLNIINTDIITPLWIIDFPMFKKNKDGIITTVHHPFTSPQNSDLKMLIDHPMDAIANAYDIVINGYEVGSGSVRIHSHNMQKTVFDILGIDIQKQKQNFGFFLNALKYGTPPHAGIALGLDRLIMIITGTDNIRDVIAFPKSTSAIDLMSQTPSFI